MVILKISIEHRAKSKKIIQYIVVSCSNFWFIWYEIISLSEKIF